MGHQGATRAPPTAVDLFCGSGGLSAGLQAGGFRVIAAADSDPDACLTYQANFPDTVLFNGDLTVRAVRDELVGVASEGRLDLLAGGPPCQAFSQVRNHGGDSITCSSCAVVILARRRNRHGPI